jgi:3',5'-cyclic AMP phosphodiesterase CpdA
VLAAVTADVKAQAPDHIAVTGDLVNLSLPVEFQKAQDWLKSLDVPADVTVVPGNHDAYVRSAAAYPQQYWGAYMRGDRSETFPFVRRRGPIALIGVSTAVPTPPLSATGRVGRDQLQRLGDLLEQIARERLFRVVLIHHPPVPGANHFRRLVDAEPLREVLRKHGADLVLHGHHHVSSVIWLSGGRYTIPCVGVPSASEMPGHDEDPGGYHLFEIDGEPGNWLCTMRVRGLTKDGSVAEVNRTELGGELA